MAEKTVVVTALAVLREANGKTVAVGSSVQLPESVAAILIANKQAELIATETTDTQMEKK